MMPLLMMEHLIARQAGPDTREALAPYWNQRITVQAVFRRFGFTQHARKVAVIERVMYEDELIADHIWIGTNGTKRLHLKRGCLICFEARVYRYLKANGIADYGLDDISNMKIVSRKGV